MASRIGLISARILPPIAAGNALEQIGSMSATSICEVIHRSILVDTSICRVHHNSSLHSQHAQMQQQKQQQQQQQRLSCWLFVGVHLLPLLVRVVQRVARILITYLPPGVVHSLFRIMGS